ncbi:MAG: putative membrane protein [Candidatus Omnitrophota bacterium]|jgi:putative membrane protein
MSESQRHIVDKKKSFKEYIALSLKGFCMGIADVIPGISGGTIAFMLSIYEDLILSIKSFDLNFAKLIFTGKIKQALEVIPWRFLLALGAGIVAAVISMAKAVTWLLEHHPILINAFFFGLILLTVPIIGRRLKKWNVPNGFALIFSSVSSFYLVMMVPMQTPEAWWFIFLSGALAICAMILPGISGSFILLLLGKYDFILNAIHEREISVILTLMCGMAVGLLLFVRVLEWLFRKAHDLTIAILTGFVAGSLNKIWPWKNVLETITTEKGKVLPVNIENVLPRTFDGYFFLAIGLFVLGSFLAYLLFSHSEKKETGEHLI